MKQKWGKPPTKDIALNMSKFYWQAKPRTKAYEQLSWNWLFVWVFYDMWVEGWWND